MHRYGTAEYSVKVGDLVVCASVPGRPVGLVMSRHNAFVIVLISGVNKSACFQPQHLELINASR
jgi:hypothetical protein